MNTTSTTQPKTNVKLAAELKSLGFVRGLSNAAKSDFRRSIKTNDSLGHPTSVIRVDVHITNLAEYGHDWKVSHVSLHTRNVTTTEGFISGPVNLTEEAQDELFDLLEAVRAL